ncbi:GbsR/MarR family transcriptional regulator [Eisenibacter elegans]|uniref:GbsR/MarR family transcriptional regulator n=1 Tax=Eisenibacter elegans TaxID=997 RepID=UPI0003F86702|nr:MarR family transcriptional regulator [Eisenibacter elegans]
MAASLIEAKDKFIDTWGTLGSNWGINRTMAQIHALLLVSAVPLTTEDVMEHLGISRGNANMNLRELLAWGLIHKTLVQGERKEYFVAEKDMWEVSRCILRERKKREFDQAHKVIVQLAQFKPTNQEPESEAFKNTMSEMLQMAELVERVLSKLAIVERSWIFKKLLKLFV